MSPGVSLIALSQIMLFRSKHKVTTKEVPIDKGRKMEDMHSHTEGAGVQYLKKPAALNKIVRCYIEAKTPIFAKTPSFELWDGVPPRHVSVKGKFLLAGRRRRRLTSTEHIISSDPNLSKGTVVGQLRVQFF